MRKGLHYLYIIVIGCCMLLVSSCSNTRFLKENQTLYVGSEVKIQDSAITKKAKKKLESELEDVVRPRPNSSFLGIRFKLYIYNIAGEPKTKKGLRNWLRNKLGEPPVLGSDLNIETNTAILSNYMGNQGFLHATAVGSKETKNKRTKAYFEVTAGPRTTIRNVKYYDYDTLKIANDIAKTRIGSFLKSGNFYDLETIKKERSRISDNLKMRGYYYFNPDYILIFADTGIGSNQVDLTLKLKLNEMPPEAYFPYTINDVVILSNYRLNNNRGSNNRNRRRVEDTIEYQDFKLVDRQQNFKPKVFHQAMQLKPGRLYNINDQNRALNRLVTLGAFKFVKNEFTPVEDTSARLLNVTYLLTPAPKKSFNIELGGFSQDDSRLGSRVSFSWRNKNFLKGAELFTVKLTGGLEAQYGGEVKRPNTYNFGLETSLNIPRFIVPFFKIRPSGMFIPRTLVNLNYNHITKASYYRINTYTLGLGYNWKENVMKDHKLFPINISYVNTDTINKNQVMDVNLSNLVYNGLIIGPTYEYTYNSQLGRRRKNNFYFFGAADLAGNILGLAQGASLEEPEKKQIFGATYAQYLKFQTDFRYYHNFSEKSILAARLFLGFGYPYGNSYQMPNIKQFFSGGSSSLRGFASRLVGPGAFNESYSQGNNTFVEMLGDIKGEFNLEWRTGIYRFINGALFLDAGNIWLLRDNPDFPGGQFTKSFYKEIAMDVGLGLRFDFSILILRLDLGMPIRKPWYPEGERWRVGDFQPGDPVWRKQNLFLNLAIGYPF